MAHSFITSVSGYFFFMTSKGDMNDFTEMIAEKVQQRSRQLGRGLTAKELIEIINEPDPNEIRELEIVYDDDQQERVRGA
jgi:hypothetical protein